MIHHLLISMLALGVLAEPPIGTASDPIAFAGPFFFERNLIFIDAQLNDETNILCLLDTGATTSAIDKPLADRLELKQGESVTITGTTGSFSAPLVAVDSLSIHGGSVQSLEPTAYDLSGIQGVNERPVGMIVGYDFLRRFAIDIDFENRWMILFNTPAPARTAIPMSLEEKIPIVEGTLNDTPIRLRLDTGASLFETDRIYINITAGTLEQMLATDPNLTSVEQLSGTGADGKMVDLPVYRIESFTLGDTDYGEAFAIVQPRAGYFADKHALGFISNNLLRRHNRIVLDYLRSQVGMIAPDD